MSGQTNLEVLKQKLNDTEVDAQLDLSSGDLGSKLKLQGLSEAQKLHSFRRIKKMIYNCTTKILDNQEKPRQQNLCPMCIINTAPQIGMI